MLDEVAHTSAVCSQTSTLSSNSRSGTESGTAHPPKRPLRGTANGLASTSLRKVPSTCRLNGDAPIATTPLGSSQVAAIWSAFPSARRKGSARCATVPQPSVAI